jgi:hypothetical protein
LKTGTSGAPVLAKKGPMLKNVFFLKPFFSATNQTFEKIVEHENTK